MIFMAAMLYSSVGHGGASAYLAAMALWGVEPGVMKPSALSLNILVAAIGLMQFARAGAFSWQTFWPFALGSIPAAYFGGAVSLPGSYYRPLVGLVLLLAAARLFLARQPTLVGSVVKPPYFGLGLASGAAIGFVSGLTGTGGGIFLSPLLILLGWADYRQAAGVSAAFILVNSVAGLAGLLTEQQSLPQAMPIWAVSAVAGGFVGSQWGSTRLRSTAMLRLLAMVLIVAGLKLIFVNG